MAQSLFDLFASSSAILIAQADAAMNGVASAQEQLKVLREKMAQADAVYTEQLQQIIQSRGEDAASQQEA